MVQAGLFSLAGCVLWSTMATAQSPTYAATYTPEDAPYHTEQSQSGYNQCGTGYNQTSECQNAYVNTLQDFCIWAPPEPGPDSVIGNTAQIEVAWCMKSGYGTRLIPDGTITGAHFVVTPDYVQVTGVGNLSNINVPAGDVGGELDPFGTNGQGNPVGALVFSDAFGPLEQIHEWTSFISDNQFCFRACKPSSNATTMCQYTYDVMGCEWSMPGNYSEGTFESCLGDSAEPTPVPGASTLSQGQPVTPSSPSIPSSSSCTFYSTISNGQGVITSGTTSSPVPTIVRSHYHSQKNTHHRHFTFSATTITFPGLSSSHTPTPTSLSPVLSSSFAVPLSPPETSPSAPLTPSTSLSFSRVPPMSSQSSGPSPSTLQGQSTFSDPTSSTGRSTSTRSSVSPSQSSFALVSPLTPQPTSSTSGSSSTTAQPSSLLGLNSSSSATASTSLTSSSTSANSQGQIGSQCPVNARRTNRRNSSGGTRTVGPFSAMLVASLVASLIGLERMALTIFATAAGPLVGVLVV